MDSEYIQQFIQVIREQNQVDPEKLSDETIGKIKSILLESNNLINILVRLDDIDLELQDISLWIKLAVYDLVFSKGIYEHVLKALPADEPVSEYFKCFTYGGVICEILKISYYGSIIKKTLESGEKNKIIAKAVADTFEEKRKEELDLIVQIYSDGKKYYPEDSTFTDITDLIKSNGLPIDIDAITN